MSKSVLTIEIDLAKHELLTLAQARKLFPIPPSPTTFWRWQNGINGVRFPVVRVGGRWCTTREAVYEFIRLQTLAAQQSTPNESSSSRTPEVEQNLRAAGLL